MKAMSLRFNYPDEQSLFIANLLLLSDFIT